MADEPIEPSSTKTTTVTVGSPTAQSHFTEILYVGVVVIFLAFTMFMSHIHNDSLASKGMDFAYIVLGALTQASTGGIKRQ